MAEEPITLEEIIQLHLRARTLTIKDALAVTMGGGFVPVFPMKLKSGYGAE